MNFLRKKKKEKKCIERIIGQRLVEIRNPSKVLWLRTKFDDLD